MNWNYCPNCGQTDRLEQLSPTRTRCKACGYEHFNNAKGSVAVALLKNGQVLYSQRGIEPHKGRYDLPGGFIDFGETAQAAAVRELHEELGITAQTEQLELIGVYSNNYQADTSSVDIVFALSEWQGTPQARDDSAALVWRPADFINSPEFYNPDYAGLADQLADEQRS